MDLSRGAQLQNSKDTEMQSPRPMPTPATPNHEGRPEGNAKEITATGPSSQELACTGSTSSSPARAIQGFLRWLFPVQCFLPQASSFVQLLPQIGGWKQQLSSPCQFLSNLNSLPIADLHKDGNRSLVSAPVLLNLNVSPEKMTPMGVREASSTALVPVTPAKGEGEQDTLHHEQCGSVNDESSNKGSKQNSGMVQSAAQVSANQGSSTPIAPLTPDMGKTIHLQEVIDLDAVPAPVLLNVNVLPDGTTPMGVSEALSTSLVPVTPAKGEGEQDSLHHEQFGSVNENFGMLQSAAQMSANRGSSTPVAPLTPDTGKTIHLQEVIDLVGQGSVANESMQEQGETHKSTVSSEKSEKEEQRDGQEKTLNTKKQKTRRKKHRPKIVIEGKTKTPKPETPQPAKPKRSYVRKKKSLNSLDNSPDANHPSIVEETADPQMNHKNRSVKRKLSFESEIQGLDERRIQGLDERRESAITREESQAQKRCAGAATTPRTISTLQLDKGMDVQLENKTGVFGFDLNRISQILDEYINLPEKPCPSAQKSRKEMLISNVEDLARRGKNTSSVNNLEQPILKTDQRRFHLNGYTDVISLGDDQKKAGEQRNHSQCCINGSSEAAHFLQFNNEIYQASGCHETIIHGCQFPETHKRKRTGKRQSWKNDHSKHQISEEFNTTNTQGLTADRMQAPQAFLTLGQTQITTKKRSKIVIRARKSLSNLTSDAHIQLYPTPEKSPQACMEALLADNRMKTKTRKRTRKGHSTPKSISGDAAGEVEPGSCSSLGQNSIGLTAYADFQAKNLSLPHLSYIWDNQSTRNAQQSACSDLMSQAIVPYGNPAYDTFSNSININWGQDGNTAELQNALVPYGSRMMVPYGESFDIKKKPPRAKVDLDQETNRVWKLLMGKEGTRGEEPDVDKEKWWEEERQVFCGRTEYFIARMRELQGNRSFSPWKGSVVDSVVGVFLTQNVSDHLSSSAFMSLAARFPPRPTGNDIETDAKKKSTTEQDGSAIAFNKPRCQEKDFGLKERDLGSQVIYDAENVKEKEMVITNDTTESSPRDGVVGDSDHKGLHVLRKKEEIDLEAPDDKTDASINETGGTESEDRSQEDVLSSQDSVASFDNSSDSLIQTTNKVELGLATNSQRDLQPRCVFTGVSNSTSYEESIHITETRTHEQELYTSVDGVISFAETSGALDQEACAECEKSMITDGLCNHSDTHESITHASTTQHSQHDTICETTAPSTSSDSDNFFGFKGENLQQTIQVLDQVQHCPAHQDKAIEMSEGFKAVQSNLMNEASSFQNIPTETAKTASRAKKANIESEKTFDWDSLRKEACRNGYKQQRNKDRMDSLDWEAVRCASVNEIAEAIRERGMNNILGGRIKDFLNRLVKDHGSLDLEWLRDVPPDKAKDYLLSIRGLGLKSVECVRLLTLHHLAFPVDTNVGRICVRLGWVPLQPLPESLQLHLLELYPMMDKIQKYLWPRLCTLDQRTLYELHYQMITFGKVFCTKSKPNCNVCPMRLNCKHFASAYTSARLALPGPEEKGLVSSTTPSASEHDHVQIFHRTSLPQLEASNQSHGVFNNNYEPIIEEPASPEPECTEIPDIEDAFYEDPDEILTLKLNVGDEFTKTLQSYIKENISLEDNDVAKALVAITAEAASIPLPKLKNVARLRTEHHVYELPDTHKLLEGLDQREPDDPCPYLLAIWTPGETAQSIEPPETHCDSKYTGKLCDKKTCFACSCRREDHAQTVRGTILIPCRTANRGSFPLNGTYFQVNEVFADHESSHNPIDVPRQSIWNLPRRNVYFGTSIPSIFKELPTEKTKDCFWAGYICIRGFDRTTRAPMPLCNRLHCAASKMPKKKKELPKDG